MLRRHLKAQLHVVVAVDRGLLALLRTLLEMEQWRVLRQCILHLVLGPGKRYPVKRNILIALLARLMKIWLRRPKTLLIINALLVKGQRILAMRYFVVRITVLRISLDQLAIIVYLCNVPVHVIDKHAGDVCFYQ